MFLSINFSLSWANRPQSKKITFSFWAKKGANWSKSGGAFAVTVTSGTGTDQSLMSGLSGASTVISTTFSLTTTWTKYSVTSASVVPTNSTQLVYQSINGWAGTAGADDSFYVTGLKIEVGESATDFEPRSYGEELSLCHRYYQRADGYLYTGWNAGTTYGIGAYTYYGGEMRANPTCTANGNFQVEAPAGGAATASIGFHEPMQRSVRLQHNLSGMTTGHPAVVSHTNSSSYLEFDAEI